MRTALNIVFLLWLSTYSALHAQTLIINEVSNGPTGNMEYVEFVVIDTAVVYDCNSSTPPCVDIRGWIFDDNSGYHGATGVAAGAIRFAQDPLWSCVPVGTIIVIYNNSDPNTSMPAVDVSLNDGNCVIVAPVVSPFFDRNLTTPGAVACSYPAAGWVNGGDWSTTLLANSGDCARLVDLSGCEVFSLCYAGANANPMIYFNSGGSGSDNVWYFNDGDPYSQANWSEGCADPSTCGLNEQTPGAPNNAANAAYIGQFNNNCLPIPPLVVNAVAINASCQCDGTASANASGSMGGYSYQWFNSAFVSIGQNTSMATNLCPGTYHCIITSGIGCVDTATVNIVSPTVINPNLTTTNPGCAGNNGTASVNPTGGIGPYTIHWSPSPGAGQGTNNATSMVAGNYSVSVTDISGCSVNQNFTLIAATSPSITSVNSSNISCNGLCDGTISLVISGGQTPYSYSWNNGASSSSLNSLCAGNYSVTVSDNGGCTTSASATITEPTAITVGVTGTDPTCGNNNGTVQANPAGGTIATAYSYIWFDNAFNVLPSSQSLSNLSPGDYTVVVSDDNGCSASGMITLIQPGAPTLSHVFTDVSCNGGNNGTIDLTVNGIAPFVIAWTGPSFSSAQEDLSSLPAGTYSVIVSDAGGCSATSSVLISEPAALSATISPNQTVCPGTVINLDVIASGGTAPYVYAWDNGNTSAQNTITVISDSPSCVSVTDANNCPALQICSTVQVYDSLQIQLSADTIVCPGSLVQLNASILSGSGAPYIMNWMESGISLGNNTSLSFIPSANSSIVFSVQDLCATVNDTVNIQLFNVAVPTIVSDVITGCVPLTVAFSETSGMAGNNCVWTFGNAGSTDDCMNSTFTFSQAGCYDISYALTTTDGCSTSVTVPQMICAVPNPTAAFVPSTYSVSTFNNQVELQNSSSNATSYFWYLNSSFFSNQENENLVFDIQSEEPYQICLAAYNDLGCADSVCAEIEIIPDIAIYVPNAFTPNGDSYNNYFMPIVSGQTDEYHFMIFDRWGALLFESFTPGVAWDGTYKGVRCPIDTYVWVLMVYVDNPGKEYNYKGHVSIIK